MSWSDAKRPNIAGTHLPLSQQSAELNDKTVYPKAWSPSGEGTWIGWWIKTTGLPIFYWNYMLKGYEWFFQHDTAFKGDAA